MLIDLARIDVRAGDGGNGCVSLRREARVPKGGPDGGNGGRGGDVTLVGDANVATLLEFRRTPRFVAGSGEPGGGSSCTGANGEHRVVAVPLGTVVADARTGELLGELNQQGQTLLVARGGRGGFGNEHFKSATDQTPRRATPGEPGGERTLRLELKLIADVGLIGKPNAGKSTLLRAVSRARPEVADYPFTTKSPHLGIAELPGERDRRLVVADIPGLIEGAAGGRGLGHDFLRHVERTSVLVHLIDVAPIDGGDPAANYQAIRAELKAYSAALAEKPEIVVLNKIDLVPAADRAEVIERLESQLHLAGGTPLVVTSGASREGVEVLLEACWRAVGTHPPGWGQRAEPPRDRTPRQTAAG